MALLYTEYVFSLYFLKLSAGKGLCSVMCIVIG